MRESGRRELGGALGQCACRIGALSGSLRRKLRAALNDGDRLRLLFGQLNPATA